MKYPSTFKIIPFVVLKNCEEKVPLTFETTKLNMVVLNNDYFSTQYSYEFTVLDFNETGISVNNGWDVGHFYPYHQFYTLKPSISSFYEKVI